MFKIIKNRRNNSGQLARHTTLPSNLLQAYYKPCGFFFFFFFYLSWGRGVTGGRGSRKEKEGVVYPRHHSAVLGDSGGVVNSLDFCVALLQSPGCFYFRCVLSSQWKAVTVNLRILHCQLGHFWRSVVRMCLATSNNLLLVL